MSRKMVKLHCFFFCFMNVLNFPTYQPFQKHIVNIFSSADHHITSVVFENPGGYLRGRVDQFYSLKHPLCLPLLQAMFLHQLQVSYLQNQVN